MGGSMCLLCEFPASNQDFNIQLAKITWLLETCSQITLQLEKVAAAREHLVNKCLYHESVIRAAEVLVSLRLGDNATAELCNHPVGGGDVNADCEFHGRAKGV